VLFLDHPSKRYIVHSLKETLLAYKAAFAIPARELGNGYIEIHIHRDTTQRKGLPKSERNKEKLGRLLLSKGGVEWLKKDAKKGIEKSWWDLARLIEETAK
jgi:hypothetical protein